MRSLLIAILISLCVSCAPTRYIDKIIPVETVRTEYVNQLYKDSIFVHDSIDRYISGDTVYQYKYKYVYKYLNRTDTVIKIDSIPKIVTIKETQIKEVNKIKWWQHILMYSGIAFITSVVISVYRKVKTIIK